MGAPVGPGYAARMGRRIVLAVAVLAAAVLPGVAKADASWYPHPADATWTYQWSDTTYNPVLTKEKITVKDQKAKTFNLSWSTLDLGNPDDAVQRSRVDQLRLKVFAF